MPAVRAKIVQISDLHMNRKVDSQLTGMLQGIIKQYKPDVLVVSGDLANQPVPWQMKKAAKLVRKIKQSCGCQNVMVLAGNHDFKFWGNVGLRRLTRIPFEIYFRRDGLEKGLCYRLRSAAWLALNSLWWKGKDMREPVVELLLESKGVALLGANSNTLTEMMAAGKVDSRDLQGVYNKADEKSPFWYKIAVVHHHPAPIAAAPTDAIARIQESFMIFYNAGLFLRELSRRGFSLVLHGHKHVAGFVRVGHDFADRGRTSMAIAAAGSACHPAPDDSRGNHLNVIEIFDDDTAKLQSWFFSAAVEKKEASRRYELATHEDVRRRRHDLFRWLKGYAIKEVVKNVEITRGGYTSVEIFYQECRVSGSRNVDAIPISLTTSRPVYLRGVDRHETMSSFVSMADKEQSSNQFSANLTLRQNRTSEDGPFEIGYRYRLMNAHVLTAQELARHYGDQDVDSEYASITCDEACEVMTLNVQFPLDYPLETLEFEATAEYVPAPLTGTDDQRLDHGRLDEDTPLPIHDVETKRINGFLRRHSNGYMLSCPEPTPGIVYKLRWKFLEAPEKSKRGLTVDAAVAAAKARLLALAGKASSKDRQARSAWGSSRKILEDLGGDINRRIAGPEESLQINVMVFDEPETEQRLRFVCSNSAPDELPKGDFYSGEGCAGFAFEKAQYVLYHPARDELGRFIDEREPPAPKESVKHVVLACFPWLHDPNDDERRLALGVVNVSSSKNTTKLLQLFDMDETESEKVMKQLQDLANMATQRLFGLFVS